MARKLIPKEDGETLPGLSAASAVSSNRVSCL